MMFLAIILLTIGLISSFYANNLKGKIYKTGLSLIKGENNKYTLIPQSKIIDTELN